MSKIQLIVNPNKIAWKLYDTEIVQLYNPDTLILDCGGWATPTTAKNINKVLADIEAPVRAKIKTVKIGTTKERKIFATIKTMDGDREVYMDVEFTHSPFRYSDVSIKKVFEEEEG